MPWLGLAILLALLLIFAALVAHFFFDVGKDNGDSSDGGTAIATGPTGGQGTVAGHSKGPLGFPSAATRNTTRISGNDPVE